MPCSSVFTVFSDEPNVEKDKETRPADAVADAECEPDQAARDYGSLCAFESSIGNAEAFGEPIDEGQQIQMLKKQCEQALQDGYMMETAEFEHLHYEDPRVTNLKMTNVSTRTFYLINVYAIYMKNHLDRQRDVRNGRQNYLRLVRSNS